MMNSFSVIMRVQSIPDYTYNQGQTTWKKLQFLCEIAHYGKVVISIFQQFFASINKMFVLGGGLWTRL